MSDSVQIFDPYTELPFVGYRSLVTGKQEKYWSIMHFVEAEKLRGVDEDYRAYILGLRDRDDFILETAGVAAQLEPSAFWTENRLSALYTALYMQLVQNKDTFMPVIMDQELEYPSQAIKQARDVLVERLASPEPWRRVLFLGQQINSHQVTDVLDHIFSNRNPDEMFILDEPGVVMTVEQYAHDNYIPIRIMGIDASPSSLEELLGRLSHIFFLGSLDAASVSARRVHDAALAKGTKVHQVDLAE